MHACLHGRMHAGCTGRFTPSACGTSTAWRICSMRKRAGVQAHPTHVQQLASKHTPYPRSAAGVQAHPLPTFSSWRPSAPYPRLGAGVQAHPLPTFSSWRPSAPYPRVYSPRQHAMQSPHVCKPNPEPNPYPPIRCPKRRNWHRACLHAACMLASSDSLHPSAGMQ
eukprot:365001-Chlamydomonas_euryale.AAC.16